MNLKTTLFLLFFLLGLFCLNGQTIISHEIRIGDSTQLHTLYTTQGYQFLGVTRFIRNDTVGFQIRSTPEINIFHLDEITFLGLSEESFALVSAADLTSSPVTEEDYREQYPLPVNQLLYSGTAIPYASRGVYRNTMILLNQVDYQVTDNFAVSGGTLIPALISGRVQLQLSASEMLHLGLAVQHNVLIVDEQSSTHPYAIVTLGKRERYLNFTMGYWIDRSRYSRSNDTYPMVTLGASFAFAPGWRFYVDGAAVFRTFNSLVIPSFNFTNQRKKGALEFGVVTLPESSFPLLPLLSYQRVF